MANLKKAWAKQDTILERAKESKKEELNASCQKAILEGFKVNIEGETYHVSYDHEAQQNIQDVLRLFDNEMIESYRMTLRKQSEEGIVVRVSLDEEQFSQLHYLAVKHRERNISILRDVLEPFIDSLSDIDEVRKISWEESVVLSEEPETPSLNYDNTLKNGILGLAETLDVMLPKGVR